MLTMTILRGSAVAAGAFLAGLPLVVWLTPEHGPVDATHADIVHDATPNQPVERERVSAGVLNLRGRLIARQVRTEEEGVSHTNIVSVGPGPEKVIGSVRYCFPVAWSPVDENVLLLHESAADDDERNFAINVLESSDHREYVGCRHCRFRNWSPFRDAILFDCENGLTQILNASGNSPLTVAEANLPAAQAAFGGLGPQLSD